MLARSLRACKVQTLIPTISSATGTKLHTTSPLHMLDCKLYEIDTHLTSVALSTIMKKERESLAKLCLKEELRSAPSGKAPGSDNLMVFYY